METFIQQLINGLSLGSVYALIAVGYSLVYSVLLFSNFAHGGFLVIGGYICYFALRSGGMNIWLASFAALIGAGLSAIVVERLAYRPIRERTPITLYMLIASMGMSIVIENIFVVTVGGRFRALSLVTAVVFLVGLQLFLVKTKWGLAIRAASYNLKTAGLMGVNVNRLIAIVFFVAGLLAGVGGIFLSVRYTLYPQLGMITTKAFVAAVIGGLGSMSGCLLGTTILTLVTELFRPISQYRMLIYGLVLVLVMVLRPEGIMGTNELTRSYIKKLFSKKRKTDAAEEGAR